MWHNAIVKSQTIILLLMLTPYFSSCNCHFVGYNCSLSKRRKPALKINFFASDVCPGSGGDRQNGLNIWILLTAQTIPLGNFCQLTRIFVLGLNDGTETIYNRSDQIGELEHINIGLI